MEIVKVNKYEFLEFKKKNARFIFSTAKEDLDFNKATIKGKENLNLLKEWFDFKEVGYSNQIHSSLVYTYDGIIHEGDSLITHRKDVAIGVFTADCVPVLMYDEKKEVVAAVHSGWKGTLNKICLETINKMAEDYGSNPQDIVLYIGPHNKVCCYEIGEEVAAEFMKDNLYEGIEIVVHGKLNLEKCIYRQLTQCGIKQCNIHSLDICTYCSKDYEMHSYRKSKDQSGRMFSFVYLVG